MRLRCNWDLTLKINETKTYENIFSYNFNLTLNLRTNEE